MENMCLALCLCQAKTKFTTASTPLLHVICYKNASQGMRHVY